MWVIPHLSSNGVTAMRDEFNPLQDRIENALALLKATADRDMRRKALLELKAAIDEADRVLGAKGQSVGQD
jgi:hypothetical protein